MNKTDYIQIRNVTIAVVVANLIMIFLKWIV